MLSFAVNPVAVVAATVVSFVLGALWYGQVFGKKWMELTGIRMDGSSQKNGMMGSMAGMVIGSLITTYVLAVLLRSTGVSSILGGAALGAFAWLGFVGTVSSSLVLFEKRPVGLYLLNNGHVLVTLAVSGAILAAMG